MTAAQVLVTVGHNKSVIIAQQLERPLLMSEEVARAAAGGKGLAGGGLKVVQASADRPGKRVECWGHPSCGFIHLGIVILVRRAVLGSKGITVGPHDQGGSRWQWMLAHAWE
jgi:hypothetical protein